MAPTPMAISPDAAFAPPSRRHPVEASAMRATNDATSDRAGVPGSFGRRVAIHAEDDLADTTQTQLIRCVPFFGKPLRSFMEHFFTNTQFCASISLPVV